MTAESARHKSPTEKPWVDPLALPNYGDVTTVSGNAPDSIKQLNYNVFAGYGLGDSDCFGHAVGKTVRFVAVNIDRKGGSQGRLEATTVAEVTVTKNMLNGAGMLHGGCVTTLIDNCCSTPLVVLGLAKNVNGVGVTQSMNVLFHSPAPPGTCLQITSTSISLGSRVMSSRCEITDKISGRIIASAMLNKMQPSSRL
ncbi:hypothetical protein PUNSTDRAFT_80807 [Punctularia strigosozonata HHB-11173 SS5]|uniref:uncharacterized protein n=1 Tax=Punctularia strigosozonata (strain HHB-11173) TaxID=741275 RepID=UPI0004417E43|nr:uncharacterized protein PUNSTDRAFT_80807 [Punctularia strigosozonata HHB-11173 SS5]EIN14440.1 hypothetical protein PUNSTDRAFT_80807 [Punctularia strigosozonata HHB-11173 SS5]